MAAHIEGSMKGHIQRSGQLNQILGATAINVTLCCQTTEHYPIGTEIFGHADILAHDFQFLSAIKKISATWADNDLQANLEPTPRNLNATGAWGGAALQQVIA